MLLKKLFSFKKRKKTLKKKILLIGMPCWSVEYPFHSLAQVAGIIKHSNWDYKIADFNVKIFHLVSDEDKKYWDEEFVTLWAGIDIPSYIFNKYKKEIYELIKIELKNDEYDFTAFSVNMFTRYFSLKAGKYIKSLNHDIPVIFGGVDCFPREYGKNFFNRLNEFVPDITLQGEAEITFPKFLKEYEITKNYKTKINGFLYRKKGQLIDTGEPDLPNLNDIGIIADFSQFDFGDYTAKGAFPSFLSRGCINRCAFCSESPNYKRYRVRKPQDVIKEIALTLKKANPYNDCPTIHFSDSLLNGNVKELDTFSDLIIKNGLKIQWGGQIYFRKEMTREFLEKLKRSGCIAFFWGFESGSQTIVNAMRKKYNMDIAEQIVTDCRDLGITNYLPIIVGFPGEEASHFVETIIFVIKYKGKNCVFFGPTPCLVRPNSALHSHFKKFGLVNNHYTDWYMEDNRNNVKIRLLRKFILGNVIRNEPLDTDNILQIDDIKHVDFDNYSVASEIASILFEIHLISNTLDSLKHFFTNFNGCDLKKISEKDLQYWSYKKIDPDFDMRNWFNKNKNNEDSRLKIISYIFESIKIMSKKYQKKSGLKSDVFTK